MFKRIFIFLTFVFCTLANCFNIVGSSWLLIDDIEISDATATVDNSAPYVCYNKSTNTNFKSLKRALDLALSNQEIIVYINSKINCYESIEIKSGVTLTIPFIGKSFDSSYNAPNVSDVTLYRIDSADERTNYGNVLGDSNASNVSKYRSILLNMRNGADIIVNGTLNLGGASTSTGNNGYYSEINLGLDSSITCNSGSTFNCFGYIKENYDDAINAGMEEYRGSINNLYDAGRYLIIKNGATLYTNLALYDVLSAGNLTGMLAAQQCPFNIFDFQSIQTYATFESGSFMYGAAIVVGPNNMSVLKDLSIISSKSSGLSSLLYIESGNISFEYKPNDARYSSRTSSINPTNIVMNGLIEIGYLYFSEYSGQVELDTRLFHLPISSKLSIYVTNGSIFNINKKVKFLMGSKLIVDEGGFLNINESVAFYNSAVAPERNTSLGIYYDSTGKDDALLCCNGTLTINSDNSNSGYLGAKITHNSITSNATLNFNSISNASYLTSEVKEGTSDTIVIVTSSGNFYDGSSIFTAQFSSGNIYTSNHQDSNYFWDGIYLSTALINVNVDNNVLFPVFEYTITLSENSDGSSPYNSELVNMNTSGSTSVTRGIYFNIVVNDAIDVSIIKSNGESISYNQTNWIYIDGDFDINIIPSEGVKINLSVFKDPNYNDNEEKWNQGTGHVKFYVQESSTENGTYVETFSRQASSFTTYVKKGNYFKVGYAWDQPDSVISLSGMNGFTANNRIYTNDNNFSPQPSSTWDNNTTSSLSGAFLAGNSVTTGLIYTFELGYYSGHAKAEDTCLLPDTLVTMSDGTYKEIKDVQNGDMVKIFNHWTGLIDSAPIMFNWEGEYSLYTILHVNFDNGKYLDIVANHGLFDIDLNEYVYIDVNSIDSYVGHNFYTCINGQVGNAKIVSYEIRQKYTKVYTPVTYQHLNYFTNDLLGIPGDIPGLFNYLELDSNMKVDRDLMQKDIEKYGLYSYEEFSNLIPYEVFVAFNVAYLKISVGKGMLTYQQILYYIDFYKEYWS